ncbi:MAG: hypothetical protein M1821_007922 [Bathelium mastoideum]|nr:MAG: hypothetical protein M1821_007922 [Bathelium mastoideum]
MQASLAKPWRPGPQKTYIFHNANIVDPVEGKCHRNQTIVLSKGIIESVSSGDGPSRDGQDFSSNGTTTSSDGNSEHGLSKETLTYDLQGKYVCPGLIDCHVHMYAVPEENDLSKLLATDYSVSLLRQPYLCKQMLQRGFTTVRDCGGANLALKEAIEDGVFPGPRLFIAGRALSQTGGHGDFRGRHDHSDCCGAATQGLARVVDGVAECTKAAREELRLGADFIKIMTGGGVASPTDAMANVQFLPEEIRAITNAAKNRNTYVTAHAYTVQSIRTAVDNGVMGIEHANMIDEPTARYLAEKGVFVTPTLVTYQALTDPAYPDFLPPESKAKVKGVLEAGLRGLEIASKAGIKICYGTDLLGPLGVAQSREFGLRAKVLNPVEILRSATITPAEMLRQERLGQIKQEFVADMLILNEDPLKDILVLDDPAKHLLAVIKDGRVQASQSDNGEQEPSLDFLRSL